MNEKMKHTRNILMGFFIGGILLPILIVLLFETEVLMPGWLCDSSRWKSSDETCSVARRLPC